MVRTPRLIGVVIALVVVVGAFAQTDQPQPVDPASWAPADTLLYVGITDVNQLVSDIKQTAFAKMMQDPAAREAWSQTTGIYRFYHEFRKRLARTLATEPDVLKNPFAGPMAVYVPKPADIQSEDVRAVLIVGVGDAALMRTYYAQAVENLTGIADQHEQVAAGAVTIDRFTRRVAEPEDAAGPGDSLLRASSLAAGGENLAEVLDQVVGALFSAESMPNELALCLTDDRLVVAPTVQHARWVLEHTGGEGTLADAAGYKEAVGRFEQLGTVRFYADVSTVFELLRAVDGDQAAAALKLLGAESVQTLAGHIRSDFKQFESRFELFVALDGERHGLPKIFSMPNRPIAPPACVPADALLYASANVQPAEAVDEVARMIALDSQELADNFRAGLEAMPLPDGATLNIRQTLINNLRGPLVYSLRFQTPYGPRSTRIELTLGHADQKAVSGLLSSLGALAPGMVVVRDQAESIVVDLPLAGFSITATPDALVAGTPGVVEAAMEKAAESAPSLAESARFRQAAQFVPPEAWGVVYVDTGRMFEAAIELARNQDTLQVGKMTSLANLITLSMVEALTQGLAEDEAACRRMLLYQAPSITTVSTEPDGLRLVQVQLLPQKESGTPNKEE